MALSVGVRKRLCEASLRGLAHVLSPEIRIEEDLGKARGICILMKRPLGDSGMYQSLRTTSPNRG